MKKPDSSSLAYTNSTPFKDVEKAQREAVSIHPSDGKPLEQAQRVYDAWRDWNYNPAHEQRAVMFDLIAYTRQLEELAKQGFELSKKAACSELKNQSEFLDYLIEAIEQFQHDYMNTFPEERLAEGYGADKAVNP